MQRVGQGNGVFVQRPSKKRERINLKKRRVILSGAKKLQFPSASHVRSKPKMEILRSAQNDSDWMQTDTLPKKAAVRGSTKSCCRCAGWIGSGVSSMVALFEKTRVIPTEAPGSARASRAAVGASPTVSKRAHKNSAGHHAGLLAHHDFSARRGKQHAGARALPRVPFAALTPRSLS